MEKRITWANTIAIFLASLSLFTASLTFSRQMEEFTRPVVVVEKYSYNPISEFVYETRNDIMPTFMTAKESVRTVDPVTLAYEQPKTTLSQSEIELIARITMAEAEGESEMGQRLVIDTILNRVEHEKFPDTVYDVIHQKNQFSVVGSERLKRCYAKESIVALVKEELANRTNSEVVFFRGGHYGKYGTPLFQVGGHYFPKYV